MNSFRTTFNIPEFDPKLNYQSKSLFIGSCFTENIGNYLKDLKFQITINPTGIIYNPVSICECIGFLLKGKQMEANDLGFYNDTWFSFMHHSRYSDPDKNVCLNKMNEDLKMASGFLQQADFLFITLGSAFIYTHNESKEVVANCHKFPASTFSKSILNAKSIVSCFEKTLNDLGKVNPNVRTIFTVSPVRHWNDGAIENQHSKSVLITAIHELILKHKNCSYFPAYELMMDDLRDYRFYAEDMLHPNNTAIEYIRDKFIKTFVEKDAENIMDQIQKLLQARNHRPFRAQTTTHINFKKKQLDQIKDLKRKFPFLDMTEFEEFFKKD
jgi:hypothetical protein